MFLKIPQVHRKTYALGLFCNKPADWRPATSLNTESGTGAFIWILWNLCNNIFTGVSFHKILGFFYERKRQLFYYEGTSSYIPLKIPERVNGVISQNFSGLLFPKTLQQTKTCSKSTKKACFRNVIRVSLSSAGNVGVFRRIFLKSVTGSDFRKSSSFYIDINEGVCGGVSFW